MQDARGSETHSKQRPHHSTSVLETPPKSKGLTLSPKQSHKSIFGNKGKKENFYGPSWRYVKFVQMWKETSPYQEGVFSLGFSDWRLFHSSLVSFWQNRLGFFCLPLYMQHLIPHQGNAQVKMHSHAGTGLSCKASRRRCSCRTLLRSTSFLSVKFDPKEAI